MSSIRHAELVSASIKTNALGLYGFRIKFGMTVLKRFGSWILCLSWLLLFGYWLLPQTASAFSFPAQNTTTNQPTTLNLPYDTISSLTAIDLGGDGTSELLLGSPQEFEPRIYLLRLDGSVIHSWLAYDASFTGGVRATYADIDGNGAYEIITAPISRGGPHVRVFDGYGKALTPGFFAGDKTNTSGVLVDRIRRTNSTVDDIATLVLDNQKTVLGIFSGEGKLLVSTPLSIDAHALYSMHRIDLGGDGSDELVIAYQDDKKQNTIALVRADGSLVNQFTVEATGALSAVAVPKASGQGENIAINPSAHSATLLYDGYGARLDTAETIHSNAGAHAIPLLQNSKTTVLTLPQRAQSLERTGKAIVISSATQLLSYYEDGFRINTFQISSGKKGYETPRGEFTINNKAERAYSATYGLYMPYWMSFIGGKFGIHELPEWPNGFKEGENHLGTPVSHGCVRLGIGPAQALYAWAGVGTQVIVE